MDEWMENGVVSHDAGERACIAYISKARMMALACYGVESYLPSPNLE